MEGILFHMQKYCTTDGPGIRTVVFFKGCPLRCLWCHNPESQSFSPEPLFDAAQCVDCLQCASLCPTGAHQAENGSHRLLRDRCIGCGDCTKRYCGALELSGYRASVDDVLTFVLQDRNFYETTGGGITLSGGEPLSQGAFCLELLQKAKSFGLHTCVETSGHAPSALMRQIAPYTDLFLYDCKLIDPEAHRFYTGVDNTRILSNLRLLSDLDKDIVLRCPIIPGINDTAAHFRAVAQLAEQTRGVTRIEVEPYHTFGVGKYQKLQRDYTLHDLSDPDRQTVDAWLNLIRKDTKKPTSLP